MALPALDEAVIADVKCYFCGHVSGRVTGRHGTPLRDARFAPRPGYKGPDMKVGSRLRCERCQGPVFLEDATRMARAEGALAASLRAKRVAVEKSALPEGQFAP